MIYSKYLGFLQAQQCIHFMQLIIGSKLSLNWLQILYYITDNLLLSWVDF